MFLVKDKDSFFLSKNKNIQLIFLLIFSIFSTRRYQDATAAAN